LKIEKPHNVLFCGVGGSGIVGDVLSDYAKQAVGIPVSVCRASSIPTYVGTNSLVIAVSYSGETEETLGLMRQALRKGANLIVIGSAGRLIPLAQKESIPYLKTMPGLLPRVALPEMVAAALFALDRVGVVEDASELISRAAGELEGEIESISPSAPSSSNPAKQLASSLAGKLPLLIGREEDVSVLRRFKNGLNENSKVPAFYYAVPEAYHDDVEGLQSLKELVRVQPVMLLGHEESENDKRRRMRLYDLFGEIGYPSAFEFEGRGEDRLSQLLTAITFGDYVSAYLAVLRGVDPSELMVIPSLRKLMQRS